MKIVPFPGVRGVLNVAAVAIPLLAASSPAQAQGRLDARYTVTLAGVPLGKGAWVIDITENQFTAVASGTTTGLLQMFANGRGTGASRGAMVGGSPVPASYGASITSSKKTEDIRMTLGSGDVKDVSITPETPDDPSRIPVTEAHFHGVNDPMTGSLLRVTGAGPVLSPQACQRTTPIFDGRMRYNLQFAYKRMEQVRSEKGYEGPVLVCAVYFTPIAGYVPHRSAIKYLAAQRDMEVWLAPVVNTRVLVPYRVSIPTPIGTGVMEATQFLTVAGQPHTAAAGPKTQ